MSPAVALSHESVSHCRERLQRLRDRVTTIDRGSAVWAGMSAPYRCVVVLLTFEIDSREDAREIARQPWGSFTEDQRAALAATSRELHRQSAFSGYLR